MYAAELIRTTGIAVFQSYKSCVLNVRFLYRKFITQQYNVIYFISQSSWVVILRRRIGNVYCTTMLTCYKYYYY
jgi:hypothetical protein